MISFRLATVATVAVKPTGIVKRIMALDVSANAQSDEKWGGVGQSYKELTLKSKAET